MALRRRLRRRDRRARPEPILSLNAGRRCTAFCLSVPLRQPRSFLYSLPTNLFQNSLLATSPLARPPLLSEALPAAASGAEVLRVMMRWLCVSSRSVARRRFKSGLLSPVANPPRVKSWCMTTCWDVATPIGLRIGRASLLTLGGRASGWPPARAARARLVSSSSDLEAFPQTKPRVAAYKATLPYPLWGKLISRCVIDPTVLASREKRDDEGQGEPQSRAVLSFLETIWRRGPLRQGAQYAIAVDGRDGGGTERRGRWARARERGPGCCAEQAAGAAGRSRAPR